MKECVIFGTYMPSIDKFYIGQEILDAIKKNIPNADIIAGINPSVVQNEWIECLKQYTDQYIITPPELVIDSDSSSYQSALRLYKANKKQYDFVWFLHTKGTNDDLHFIRHDRLNTLLHRKNHTLSLMQHPLIGAYSETLSPGPWISNNYPEYIDIATDRFIINFDVFKYTNFRYLTIGSMYILKGHVLDTILENTSDELLNTPLWIQPEDKEINKFDKFFFERDFITLVYKLGYIARGTHYTDWYQLKIADNHKYYKQNVKNWLDRNNLNHDVLSVL